MADLLKIADVLEKVAALVDVHEAEKTAAEKTARDSVVRNLSEKYTAATGEELPSDVLEKLASGDRAVLKTVTTMVEKTAGAVDSLGRSSPEKKAEDSRPTTKAERAKAAWDNMGRFINS